MLVIIGQTSTQTLVFTDSISTQKNANYCGQFTYTILPTYKFLQISGNSIVLTTSSPSDIGTYDSTITISLASYQNVAVSFSFKATINCIVDSSFSFSTVISDQNFKIGQTALITQAFGVTSNVCAYPYKYSYIVQNSSGNTITLPWIVYNTIDQTFQIYSTLSSDVGDYTVLITASLSPSQMNAAIPNTATSQFLVTISCLVYQEIYFKTPVANQSYTIGQPALKTPAFAVATNNCAYPYTYSYTVQYSNGDLITAPWLTLSQSAQTFKIYSSSISDIGVYKVIITASLSQSQVLSGLQNSKTSSFTVPIIFVIPKLELSPIVWDTLSDMTVNFNSKLGYPSQNCGFSVTFGPNLQKFVSYQVNQNSIELKFNSKEAQKVIKTQISDAIQFTTFDSQFSNLKITQTCSVSLSLLSNQPQNQNSTLYNNNTSSGDDSTQSQDQLYGEVQDWLKNLETLLSSNQAKNSTSKFVAPYQIPYFKSLDHKGVVKIGFPNDFFSVPNLTMITNGTIFLDQLIQQGVSNRQLINQKTRIPVLQINVLPGYDSNPANLSFTWNATNQKNNTLQIQLYFDHPEIVSSNKVRILFFYSNSFQDPDLLQIIFNNPKIFMGKNGMRIPVKSQNITTLLPTQTPLAGTLKAIEAAVTQVSSGSFYFVQGNIFINFVLSASLSQVWNMVNTEQLILNFGLLNIQLPGFTQSFVAQIGQLANFNYFDTEPFINKVLKLKRQEPLNQNFGAMGYGSIYFLNNMGTNILFFLIYPFLIFLSSACERLRKRQPRLKNIAFQLRNQVYYNFLLTTLIESYSNMSMCCLINYTKVSFKSYGEAIQTLLLIGFSILLIAVYFWLWALYEQWDRIIENNSKKGILLNKFYESRFSGFYEGLDVKKGRRVLGTIFYFLTRRLLLGITVVILKDQLVFQIISVVFTIITAVVLIGYLDPYETKFKKRMEYFNEVNIMQILYMMMSCSPLVPDLKMRSKIGISVCVLITINLAVNIYFIATDTIKLNVQLVKNMIKLRKDKQSLQQKLASIVVYKDFMQERMLYYNNMSIEIDIGVSDSSSRSSDDEGSSISSSSSVDSEISIQQSELKDEKQLLKPEKEMDEIQIDTSSKKHKNQPKKKRQTELQVIPEEEEESISLWHQNQDNQVILPKKSLVQLNKSNAQDRSNDSQKQIEDFKETIMNKTKVANGPTLITKGMVAEFNRKQWEAKQENYKVDQGSNQAQQNECESDYWKAMEKVRNPSTDFQVGDVLYETINIKQPEVRNKMIELILENYLNNNTQEASQQKIMTHDSQQAISSLNPLKSRINNHQMSTIGQSSQTASFNNQNSKIIESRIDAKVTQPLIDNPEQLSIYYGKKIDVYVDEAGNEWLDLTIKPTGEVNLFQNQFPNQNQLPTHQSQNQAQPRILNIDKFIKKHGNTAEMTSHKIDMQQLNVQASRKKYLSSNSSFIIQQKASTSKQTQIHQNSKLDSQKSQFIRSNPLRNENLFNSLAHSRQRSQLEVNKVDEKFDNYQPTPYIQRATSDGSLLDFFELKRNNLTYKVEDFTGKDLYQLYNRKSQFNKDEKE